MMSQPHRPPRALAACAGALSALLVVLATALTGVPAMAQAPDLAQVQQEPVVRYDGHAVIRVNIRRARDLRTALALTDDVWSHRVGIGGEIDIRVSPEQLAAVIDSGLEWRFFIEDLQASIDAERAEIERRRGLDGPWFENYHPWEEIRTYVQDLAAQYPQLATYEVIGQSLEGRDIFALRITGPGSPPNSTPANERPIVFFNGCQHAREWVSPATVVFIADRLLRDYASDPNTAVLLDNVEFIVVPVVNPDGYIFSWTNDRLWRKNRAVNSGSTCRGVDTNRNWGYEWGGEGASTAPCNQTFRGPAGFSEPETQVMRDYITANPRIAAAIDFHSYSELILSPWGYTSQLPPGNETFDLLNSAMQSAIAGVHGRIYAAGPSYTTIYPASGTMPDWTWGGRSILGWTIELRDTGQFGFILPPEQIIPTAEENIEAIHVLGTYMLPVRFTEPTLAPVPTEPQIPAAVSIGVEGVSAALQGVNLRTRMGSGSYTTIPMVETAPGRYEAAIPGASCGMTIEYYIEAQTADGRHYASPVAGESAPYETIVLESATVYAYDMETPPVPGEEWSVWNHSSLTSGAWERVVPIGSLQSGVPAAPFASAVGERAFVTQNGPVGGGPGEADVDGGPTVLTSPAFDLSGAHGAEISFALWHYSVGGTVDVLSIELSSDDGQTWVSATTVPHGSGWRRLTVDVGQFVPLSSQVRIRFSSVDNPNNSVTESGLDDISVRTWTCAACYANCDGSTHEPVLNVDDFTCFINQYAQAQALPHEQQVSHYANCDASTNAPVLNVDDFTCFINAYAAGCR